MIPTNACSIYIIYEFSEKLELTYPFRLTQFFLLPILNVSSKCWVPLRYIINFFIASYKVHLDYL